MKAEVTISRMGGKGQGVGQDTGGNLYFVPRSLPGDRIQVEFGETSKKYRDANLIEILHPSKDRLDPECSYFSECGGCEWLNWEYASQVKAKEQTLRHVLERGELAPIHDLKFKSAEMKTGYRTRLQLHRDGNRIGFYRKKSHEVVDIERCLVAHPKLNDALGTIRKSDLKEVKSVELTLLEDGSVHRSDDAPKASAGFTQVNVEQNVFLQETVKRWVIASQAQHVLELYCGDGNLTFPYLSEVKGAVAFDSNRAAIERARLRKQALGVTNVDFSCWLIDTEMAKKWRREGRLNYDTLILDPARSGVGKALEPFLLPNLRAIIYISCAPIQFTKDVR